MDKPRLLRTLRFVLWWVVLAAAAGLAALYFDRMAPMPSKADAAKGVMLSPAPGFEMAPFLLTTSEGKEFTLDNLAGKAVIIFYGFTNCPMICPTELADMSRWLEALGGDAEKLSAVFITVDPARDTVLALNSYMKAFDKRITALTGTEAQIEKLSKDYYFFYKKIPMEDGKYMMDHTATTYLFDNKHRFVGTIDGNEKDEIAVEKLRLLIKR